MQKETSFRTRVLANLFFHPIVSLPFLIGAIFFVLSFEGPRIYRFYAFGLSLFAVSALLCRMTLFFNSVVQYSFRQLHYERQKRREKELDDLNHKFCLDNEPRNEKALGNLRAIYAVFAETVQSGIVKEYDFLNTAEKMFNGCIANLADSYTKRQSAMQLPIKSREELLKESDALLAEVESSVSFLAESLVKIQALTSPRKGELLEFNRQLEERLEMARKTEERIRSKDFLYTPIVAEETNGTTRSTPDA